MISFGTYGRAELTSELADARTELISELDQYLMNLKGGRTTNQCKVDLLELYKIGPCLFYFLSCLLLCTYNINLTIIWFGLQFFSRLKYFFSSTLNSKLGKFDTLSLPFNRSSVKVIQVWHTMLNQ